MERWGRQAGIPANIDPRVEVAPGTRIADQLLVVETGAALSSFRLASSVLSSAEFWEGTAEENHDGRDVSIRTE